MMHYNHSSNLANSPIGNGQQQRNQTLKLGHMKHLSGSSSPVNNQNNAAYASTLLSQVTSNNLGSNSNILKSSFQDSNGSSGVLQNNLKNTSNQNSIGKSIVNGQPSNNVLSSQHTANHILSGGSGLSGAPSVSNLAQYQSQVNHQSSGNPQYQHGQNNQGSQLNYNQTSGSILLSSTVNQNHQLNQNKQSQFYSMLPTRLMAKPTSMFGKLQQINQNRYESSTANSNEDSKDYPMSTVNHDSNYYSSQAKNLNFDAQKQSSNNLALPNSSSFISNSKLASEQQQQSQKDQRTQSLVMNQARKKMASIRHSLDVKPTSQYNASSFNTLNTPQHGSGVGSHNLASNERDGSSSVVSPKYNNSLNKQSKISQSAIEIIRNNPLASSQKHPLPIQNANANATLLKILNTNNSTVPVILPSKISQKPWGSIQAYSANTHNGIARGYNEDRVSIVLDLKKPGPTGNNQTKKVSFFAVFDGHGGSACAEYLRDNLHLYVASQDQFPSHPETALKQGFKQAEEEFMKQNQHQIKEKSGSCACVVMIVDDTVYTANVGDSRAIMSMNNGQKSDSLTRDHKPSEDFEKKRIIANGGQLYQNNQILHTGVASQPSTLNIGPVRVLPGRLSVSRTFGDAHAKLEQFGGNPKVVVAVPDITHFKLQENVHDFIMICSDGIFDRMNTEEAIGFAWQMDYHLNSYTNQIVNHDPSQPFNINEISGQCVERVLKAGMVKESLDNLSVVMIAFKNFTKFVDNMNSQSLQQQQENRSPNQFSKQQVDMQQERDRQYLSSRGQQIVSQSTQGASLKEMQKFENKSFRFMHSTLQPQISTNNMQSERYRRQNY
eukprot:403333314